MGLSARVERKIITPNGRAVVQGAEAMVGNGWHYPRLSAGVERKLELPKMGGQIMGAVQGSVGLKALIKDDWIKG